MSILTNDVFLMVAAASALCGGIWLALKSPAFNWLMEVLALLFVMLGSLALGVGGAVAVHLPKGNYGWAIVCVLIGAGLSWPCCLIGWQRLKQMRSEFRSLALWS